MKRAVPILIIAFFAATASGKESQTYYTADEIATIRARAPDPRYKAEVAAILKAAAPIADRSDEEIAALVPPADLTRALTVRYEFDCPIHGKEIYKVGGRFPWITTLDKPFQVECPVGHETYPSNDFAAYLRAGRVEKFDTHQKYVDDGNGYVDADGNRYFFAGYYNFWRLWRSTLIDGTAACGNAYLLTGDPKYAHKAAIALTAIARVYPQMDYATQAYHNGKWPAGINGRILDYIWENQTVMAFAVAYDQIYPTLDAATKAAVEGNILQPMASDLLQKKIWGNKFELRSTAALALILDNHDPARGITREAMIDWLLKGGGDLEFTFFNGFDRDGIGGESSLSYSNIWNAMAVAAAEDLSRMGVDLVKDPKWRQIAKGPMEMRLLDALSPRLGDVDGDIKGNKREMNNELLMFGVTHFHDADCAAALLRSGHFKAPLLSRTRIDADELKKLAAGATFPEPPYTRDIGGYGLAVLELNDGSETHSATLYYGSPAASHGHFDRLTMSYHLGNRDVFPELGYPSQWGPTADFWVKNTVSHYGVLIDEEPQPTKLAGDLIAFANLEGCKFAEAQAARIWTTPPSAVEEPVGSIGEPPQSQPTTVPAVSDYRRMLALLDTGEKSTLLVEAFLVVGGHQHDYSFHGLPYGTFSVSGSQIVREQKTGTLAGESVAVGQSGARSGFQFLEKPRWYEPTDALRFDWINDAGISMHTWFPRLSYDHVIVADGAPPTYPGWPTTMPFVLLRHQNESGSLRSLFLSITEAGRNDASVHSVRPLRTSSPDAGGAVVEMKSGRAWKLYINGGHEGARFDDGATSSFRFAAIEMIDGKPARAHLIGAGTFSSEDGLKFSQSAGTAMKIERVDYRDHSVIVSGQAPTVGKEGLALMAARDHTASAMHASYTARAITPTPEGMRISFGDIPLIAGRFEAAWDASKKQIVSKDRTGGVYNRFVAHSFVGMSVVSEDLTTTALITAYDAAADAFTIDADPETAKHFTDCDGNGRSYVYVADLAPGVVLNETPARTVDLSKDAR